MKNKILFVISLAVLVFLAAACSKTETTTPEVGITIGPEDQAAETPVDTPAEPASPAATEPSATEPAKTDDTAASETETSTTKPASSESGLPEIDTCNEEQNLGFLKCIKQASGDSELSIRNSGRGDIDGVYVRYYKGASIVGGKSEISASSAGNGTAALQVGDDYTVSLEIKKYEADKIEVFPVWNGNVCINKQMQIKPEINCR